MVDVPQPAVQTDQRSVQAQFDVTGWLISAGFNFATNRPAGNPLARAWVFNLAPGPGPSEQTHITLHVNDYLFAVSSQLEMLEPGSYADVLQWLTNTVPFVRIVPGSERHVLVRAEFPVNGGPAFALAFDTIGAAVNSVYSAVQLVVKGYPSRFKRAVSEIPIPFPAVRETSETPSEPAPAPNG